MAFNVKGSLVFIDDVIGDKTNSEVYLAVQIYNDSNILHTQPKSL